ncbi:AraC family transcriptional regulator [Microbacterium rhizomatis]|uniref:AraC family transcriptional regulator n=1 Tax=Microbacterium rhizomatis TaxID=1631477 RepID=UPI00147978FC|nr:AraC family transcriptional regulator [Microbacterium rhizomatis]
MTGTTRGLSRGRDFDAFCDGIADVYVGVRPDRPAEGGVFDADFALFDLGGLSLGWINTPGVQGRRDRQSVSRTPDDAYFLNYSIGPWGLRQRGEEWTRPARSALLLDNTAPFHVLADARQRLNLFSLRIPRSDLMLDYAATRRVNDMMATAALGRQVAAQMGLVTEMLRSGRTRVAASMASAVVALLGDSARPDGAARPDRLEQFKLLATERMRDPRLSAEDIARAFSCSIRTVQAAFAGNHETFAAWLRDERLERAWSVLRAPQSSAKTIGSVAAECGFDDVTTFHRAFRRKFGCTPAAAR